MEQQWQIVEHSDDQQVQAFASDLNSAPALAQVMLNRGIADVDSARKYFIPRIEHLHDPFLMQDMAKAVQRLTRALQEKEKLLIYGDYDVDGATATAMMVRFFRNLGHPTEYFIPDRLQDGYGLSNKGIDLAHSQGASIIVTVDCGITACDEIAYANELGLDVIVCDHHQPAHELPAAHAVLDPKREDCPYPFNELAGVGVAFKLLQGLQAHLGLDEAKVMDLVYFVAMGSAADIVPLVDENRVLTKIGLRDITLGTANVGLRSLLEITALTGREIGTGQVVFVLAPRINAVGRLGDANRAVELLTTADGERAMAIAAILEEENRSRREIDESMLNQALDLLQNTSHENVIVLNSDDWHPGVVGIVASRLVEKFYRPAILIATDNGEGKGSARSIPGFDIYQALQSCEDLMISFGGHKYAAGLSVQTEKIPALKAKLNQVAGDILTEEMLKPQLRIDGEIRFGEIDASLLKLLRKMAPFGPQNTRPTFLSRGLQIVGNPRIVGRNHLKFKVRQDGIVMDAIGFDLGDKLYRIPSGEQNVDLVYVVDENDFRGQVSTQLRVKDLR